MVFMFGRGIGEPRRSVLLALFQRRTKLGFCVFLLADVNATDFYMQFQFGWIADPLYFGDYPAVMRNSQPKLPKFKDSEKKLLAGSTDFLAVNYYTSHFVAAAPAGAPKSQVKPGGGPSAAQSLPTMLHNARHIMRPQGDLMKLRAIIVFCACCCMAVGMLSWVKVLSIGLSQSSLCFDP
jgi:hypothetical protein